MAVKAKNQGIERKDTTGSLRRYLDALYHHNDDVFSTIYIYAEKVWVFRDSALVTVLNLPTKYKAVAKGALSKKEDGKSSLQI